MDIRHLLTCFNYHNIQKISLFFAICLILSLFINTPKSFAADSDLQVRVNVNGGEVTVADFTTEDLKAMTQTRLTYSSLDPMPAPSITLAEGVLLSDLLAKCNIDIDDISAIKLYSSDGWSHSFSRASLLDTKRYDYPDIVKGWDSASENPPEFLSGTENNKTLVAPMLALKSFQERYNSSLSWDKISDAEGVKFCYGQADIDEQSMLYFGKYINKIDITLAAGTPFISLLANGQYFKPGSSITLSGSTQNIKSVDISVTDSNGQKIASFANVAAAPGSFNFNFTLAADVAEGKYQIKAVSGNYQAAFTMNISASGKPPAVSTGSQENSPTGGSSIGVQGVPADSLTVMVGYYGGPYLTKKVFTLEEIQQLPQVKQAYTFIDSMPAVVVDSAVGVKLTDILESSGIDVNSAEAFYFYCSDLSSSWYETLPKSYLLDTPRYYYPNLPKCWDSDNGLATDGATEGAVPVDTIIAYEDNWQRFGTKADFGDMDTSSRFRLVFGQGDTTTCAASRSAKWIHSIEVMLGGTPPSGVTLDKAALALKVGSTFQLTPIVGTVDATTDKRLQWSSSDPDIVSVDSKGRIKVLAEGSATIIVTTVVGNKTAACVINGPEEDKKSQTVAVAATDNKNTNNKSTAQTSTDSQSDLQHLTTKEAASTSSVESGKQPWRAYEMSENAVALANIKEKKQSYPLCHKRSYHPPDFWGIHAL